MIQKVVQIRYRFYQLNVVFFGFKVFVDFQEWYYVVFFLDVLCCWDVVDFVVYGVFKQDCVDDFVIIKCWRLCDLCVYGVDYVEYFFVVVIGVFFNVVEMQCFGC